MKNKNNATPIVCVWKCKKCGGTILGGRKYKKKAFEMHEEVCGKEEKPSVTP